MSELSTLGSFSGKLRKRPFGPSEEGVGGAVMRALMRG